MKTPNTDSLILAKEKLLLEIPKMNLFHDTFISVVFKNKQACLYLIRVLMQNPTLEIIEYRTQEQIPQLITHSACLDVLAEDADGKVYEIEIQRREEPAPARRMRFYTALMDSEFLLKGAKYEQLPDVYLFYISQKDIWNQGDTIYEVKQSLKSKNSCIPYNNGLHTIFINAAVDDGSDIAKLMQYFKTAKAGDNSQGALSSYVNELKSPKGGKAIMDEFEKYFKKQGEDQGIELMEKLYSLGRLEDAKRVKTDLQYRAQLMKELAIQ